MLSDLIRFFVPPPQWRVPVIILLGVLLGLVVFIFRISNASSYLSSNPRTCINCHVMVPQYATWERSSHARVAKCVDCHLPHDNVVNKYRAKMRDGMRHSTIFTLRAEPQVIRIKPYAAAAVQQNCIRCHESVLEDASVHKVTYEDAQAGEGKLCWDCHREVPHGRVRSLAATPFANVPELPGVVPEWMKGLIPDNQ
jgi:cytochrome c nitrite reductase small subunit